MIKKYWNKENINYIFKTDWYDYRIYDEFIITYNRLFDTNNQIIFPLIGYHLPKDIYIHDNLNFNEKNNKLIWRGSTTGNSVIENNKRYNIISKNINSNSNFDLGFNNLVQNLLSQELINILHKDSISIQDQINSKFILCIEGNDCASNFPWALLSNCCPLHNYPFTCESYIFGQGLEPYVHFIPINNDGSDLLEKYYWCLNNMDKCEEISNNGKKYMEPYLRDDLFDEVMKVFFTVYPSFL